MLEYLEALIALADCKTLRKAALSLHVTQSALSKRIAALENQLDTSLTEPDGKYLILTPAGNRLVETSRPLVQELRAACRLEFGQRSGAISIDIASSILLAGGAPLVSAVQKELPDISMRIHNYHASVAVERVSAGHSSLALVQGHAEQHPELRTELIWSQEMVIVPSLLKPFKLNSKDRLSVLAIEEHTAAWKHTKQQLDSLQLPLQLHIEERMQSFSAIIHLAQHGFSHGIAPRALAHTLGVKDTKLIAFPDGGIHVPVSLIGRASFMALDYVQGFIEKLLEKASDMKIA